MKSILSDGVLISLEVITNHCALVFLVFLFPFFFAKIDLLPLSPYPLCLFKKRFVLLDSNSKRKKHPSANPGMFDCSDYFDLIYFHLTVISSLPLISFAVCRCTCTSYLKQ